MPPGPIPLDKSSPGICDTPIFNLPLEDEEIISNALEAEISKLVPSFVPAAKGGRPHPS